MHVYEVGKPYVTGRTSWPEHAEYNWRSGVHELQLFFSHPTTSEIADVRVAAADFEVYVQLPVVVFLYRFGDSIAWSDASYDSHRLPVSEWLAPPALQAGQSMVLQVILVEADGGLIKAIRLTSLQPTMITRLHAAILVQHSSAYTDSQYSQALKQLYSRYSAAELVSLVRQGTAGG